MLRRIRQHTASFDFASHACKVLAQSNPSLSYKFLKLLYFVLNTEILVIQKQKSTLVKSNDVSVSS